MLFLRRLSTILLTATLLVAGFAEDVDAQRRRRRRQRRQPPPAAQVEPETPAETGDGTDETDAPPATPVEGEVDADADAQAALPQPDSDPSDSAQPEEPGVEPTAEHDPGPAPPDVSPIRSDYVALMDDLVQARMRVSALGSELFRTRITVGLHDQTGGNTNLARLVVHLDGAPVFQSEGRVEGADQGREIFTGSLAPGPHVLTLEVEQRSREDDDYRYTLRESFRFQVTRERLSEVTLILEDSSDMGRSFPAGGEGRYEVRTRMRVASRALPSQ